MLERNDMEEDIFTAEFRHETVKKFVNGIINGSIEIQSSAGIPLDKETLDFLIADNTQLLRDITNYVSGKLKGEELDTLEERIFSIYTRRRISQTIKEVYSKDNVEKDIELLHTRIESTNALLGQTLILLKELMKKLDTEE
jgi:hypothetical protein